MQWLFVVAPVLIVVFLRHKAEYRRTHPVVARWTAAYTENEDGTGNRITRSGEFRKGIEQIIPETAEESCGFSISMGFPMFMYDTYYLDPSRGVITAVE